MPKYNIPSVFDFGATGNGSTDDTAAFQNALNSISNGGALLVPPGKYRLTSALSCNIAAAASVSLLGLGQDVSILNFVNNSGLVFNYGSLYSSAHVRDLTIEGMQPGGNVALTLQQAQVNQNPAVSALSDILRVTTRGDEASYPGSAWWSYGINISNVSNVTVDTHAHYGPAAGNQSTGIQIIGHPGADSGGPSYACVFNVLNSTYNDCTTGILYNAYVQGVTVSGCNFTGATYGILSPSGATGELLQLCVTNSQFACVDAIHLMTPVNSLLVSNNLFLVHPNGNGVVVASTGFNITGNGFVASGGTGNGVLVNASSLGAIVGNSISGVGTGVAMTQNAQFINVQSNIYANNGTNVYNVGHSNTVGGGSA